MAGERLAVWASSEVYDTMLRSCHMSYKCTRVGHLPCVQMYCSEFKFLCEGNSAKFSSEESPFEVAVHDDQVFLCAVSLSFGVTVCRATPEISICIRNAIATVASQHADVSDQLPDPGSTSAGQSRLFRLFSC